MATKHCGSQYTLFPSLPLSVSGSVSRNTLLDGQKIPASGRKTSDVLLQHRRRTDGSRRRKIIPEEHNQLIPLKLRFSSDTSKPPLPVLKEASPVMDAGTKPTKKPRLGPLTDLFILPYTEKEWKVIMEEVKIFYLKGQYKHCTMRCKLTLESIKHSHRIHPIYSIYLSFFLASSLEMTASTLQNHTAIRLSLYQEALLYYHAAATHVEFAPFSFSPFKRLSYTLHDSSPPSSARSSVDSVFSQHSKTSSIESITPTEEQQPQDENLSPKPPRRKKKVSFSGFTSSSKACPSPTTISLHPKTPSASILASTLLDAFPIPPSCVLDRDLVHEPISPRSISPRNISVDVKPSDSKLVPGQGYQKRVQAQSDPNIHLYQTLLAAFLTQLTYHINYIQSSIKKLRSPNKSMAETTSSFVRTRGTGVDQDDIKKIVLRERIRRLKEIGWDRKRFDAERYRRLCAKALNEMDMESV